MEAVRFAVGMSREKASQRYQIVPAPEQTASVKILLAFRRTFDRNEGENPMEDLPFRPTRPPPHDRHSM